MNSTQIHRPSTWAPYRPSLCNNCWAGCCTMPVEVNDADLIRMGLAGEDELADSPKRTAKRLMAEGIVASYRGSTGLFTLLQKPNGDCRYLGPDRLCVIYDKRPNVCRRFPAIGPRPGYCPARPK